MSAIAQAEVSRRPTAISPKRVVSRARIAWAVLLIAGLGFMSAGGYMAARGFDAKSQVRAQLLAENITTPADASVPNVKVADGGTAEVQAAIIHEHTLKATGGKSYAELARDDPARVTAFNGAALRTALLSASLAWHIGDLVIGIGAFIAAVGMLLVLTLVLVGRPPKKFVF